MYKKIRLRRPHKLHFPPITDGRRPGVQLSDDGCPGSIRRQHVRFAVNNSSGSGWIIDPFDIVAILTLIFYINYQVAIRSLRLITLLPDAVLAWIGGQARNLSYGDLMEAEGSHREFMAGFASQTTRNISPNKQQEKPKPAAADPNTPPPPPPPGGGEGV